MNITSFTNEKIGVSKTNEIDESYTSINQFESTYTNNSYSMYNKVMTEANFKFIALNQIYRDSLRSINAVSSSLVELYRNQIGLGIQTGSVRIYSSVTSSYFYDVPITNAIGKLYAYDNGIDNDLIFYEGFNSYVYTGSVYRSNRYDVKSNGGVVTTGSQLIDTGLSYNIYSTQSFYDIPYISFRNDDNYSLSFWFKPTSSTVDVNELAKQQNICYFVNEETSYPFHFYLTHSSSNVYNLNFNQKVNNSVANYKLPTEVSQNTWNHVNLVKSQSTYDLYLNGTLATSSIFTHPSEFNTSNVRFGGIPTWLDTHNPLKGNVDEIRIYNTNISSSVVTKLSDNEYASLNMYNYTDIGEVWYKNGLVVLNHPSPVVTTIFDNAFNLYYDSTNEINVHEVILNIPRKKFNVSLANSLRKDTTIPQYKDFVFEEWFTPYITKIGMYNKENELIAIASLPYPIKKPKGFDLTFIIRYDII